MILVHPALPLVGAFILQSHIFQVRYTGKVGVLLWVQGLEPPVTKWAGRGCTEEMTALLQTRGLEGARVPVRKATTPRWSPGLGWSWDSVSELALPRFGPVLLEQDFLAPLST